MEVLLWVGFGLTCLVAANLLVRFWENQATRRAGLRPTNGFTDSRDCGWRRPSDV